MGLIEVLSPPPAYYPDFDALPLTLGDSMKRVKWRTKQNLDTIYLMAYAQSKGTFYLMLEDDVIAKNNYIKVRPLSNGIKKEWSNRMHFFISMIIQRSELDLLRQSQILSFYFY